jgi:hypothetical protein
MTGDRAHELTRAEESQAIALIPALVERIEHLTGIIESMASRLGVDPRTCVAMSERGEIVTRRAGRRVLVDAASLRPADPSTVARLAREARS